MRRFSLSTCGARASQARGDMNGSDPLPKTVRNRGYAPDAAPYDFYVQLPLCMASVRKNYSLTALVHLIYVLFKVVYL